MRPGGALRLANRAVRLMRLLEPERAHRLAIAALRLAPISRPPDDPRLSVRVLGRTFPNPVGLAAGFDKNGEAMDPLLRLGFGFIEIGTVTPRPQAGNPRPRLFRLAPDRALVNRMGFNNEGADALEPRLAARSHPGIVGINIGANRDSADPAADYVSGVSRFAPLADYLAINVSSPNTPGLRDLQAADRLDDLLRRARAARDAAGRTPLLLKVAPDLDDDALSRLVETALRRGINGLIVANTTVSRAGLSPHRHAREAGGLSGRPLFARSTAMLARARMLAGPDLTLVGVGGVDTPDAAFAKISAGADLVQLYTGLVYEGPSLAARIQAGLVERLDAHGLSGIAEARGREARRWEAAWRDPAGAGETG